MTDNPYKFDPAWWIKGAHFQTIWPALFRSLPSMGEHWERIDLPDGDFLDCVWDKESFSLVKRPIVILLHGIEGGIRSSYSKGLMTALTKAGFRPVMMHFRTCSGPINRLDRAYSAGDTQDLSFVAGRIKKQYPEASLHAVGFSIGGSVLCRWLGETGNKELESAVSVSTPFDLDKVANRLASGFSKVYQWNLLKHLKRKYKQKFKGRRAPIDMKIMEGASNFWEFDNYVTAPLHGFKDVYDYYEKCSSRRYLSGIAVRTLIIHAKDDPFMYPDVIPSRKELSPMTKMLVTERGGHMGFLEGKVPGWPRYWLERVITHFLSEKGGLQL